MKNIIFAYTGARTGLVYFVATLFFVVLFLFLPKYSLAAPNTDTMLGYWKFDGNVTDSSGDGNTGSLLYGSAFSGQSQATSFLNSGSATFPSLSSYIEVPNQPGVSPADGITFSMWLRFNQIPTGANQSIAGNYNGGDYSQGFEVFTNDGTINFSVGNGVVSVPTAGNITPGNWVNIIGTWDHANIRLYLDGALLGTMPYTTPVSYTGTVFRLGNFLGEMDEVRLYNRALTAGEISDLAFGNHTSIIWDGTSSIDYENIENWNLGIIPDPYTIINIPNVTNAPEFSQSEGVAGINILANSSLNIRSYNLKISDSGVFSNDGNFILENIGTQVIIGFINDTNSGTVTIEGAATGAELKTGSQYYNLTMNGTGSINSQPAALAIGGNLTCNNGIFNLLGNTVVHGNIVLNGGHLSASSASPISFYGNWYSQDTTSFAAGDSTVALVGADQAIAGSNTFYNLTSSSSVAKIITFQSGATQTIQNNLYLHGTQNNLINLRASTAGTAWRINPAGTVSIDYISVMDSNNIGVTPIDATSANIFDSGNNTNWIFDATNPQITIDYIAPVVSDALYSITGNVTDESNILEASFRIDADPTEFACAAGDGLFDEISETFICTPVSNLNEGVHTFYINIRDIYDNATPAAVDINVDTIAPTINYFSIPDTADSLVVTVNTFTASGANSYILTESATTPLLSNPNWSTTPQSSYSFTSAGAKTLYAWARDTAGNISISLNDAVNIVLPDIETPTISSIEAIANANSAQINWITNESASSRVEFGNTSSYGQSTAEQDLSALVQNHAVLISGLTSCTLYHFRVISRDEFLNQALGTDQSFTTGGCVTVVDDSDSSDCDLDKPGDAEITSIEAQSTTSLILEIDEASGDVDEYEIKYGTSSDNFQWNVDDIDEDDIDSFVINELSPGTTYYFKARAKNECEKGDWSDEMSEKTDSKVATNYSSEVKQTPIIEDKVEPAKEVINIQKDVESDNEPVFISADNEPEDNSSDEENDDSNDVKKNNVPITQECGPSSVEMIDGVAGLKKIKITGYGPPNTTLKVYVYSDDPTVLTVKTDKDGNWSYVLDGDLEDGEHQVYVAVTEDTGKITAKSNPLVFVKTAQAVSVVSSPSVSPTEKAKSSFMISAILISVTALFFALLIIGWRFRSQKTEEKVPNEF